MAFPVEKFGKKGGDVIVFLAGFPDNCTSGWGNTVVEFSKTHRCLCFCLPGFQDGKVKPWGYSLQELREMFHSTLTAALKEEGDDDIKVTFIIHDWGSYIGMCYVNKYPERIKRVVAFDVGILNSPRGYNLFIILLYQMTFAFIYLVSQLPLIGNLLANIWATLYFLLTPKFLAPCPHDKVPRPRNEITVNLFYPYYQQLLGPQGYVRNMRGMMRPKFPFTDNKDTVSPPLMFLYGTKKNAFFHSDSFIKRIDATAGCSHKSYETGHWLQLSRFQPDIIKQIYIFMNQK